MKNKKKVIYAIYQLGSEPINISLNISTVIYRRLFIYAISSEGPTN